MQKSLFALSFAGALLTAGSACAADVQLYGLINTGLDYVHADADVAGVKSTDKWSMENAQQFGSRWGIRGAEDLGNGIKVGFVLESGFEADTGALDTKQLGRLFGRECQIYVTGDYGTVRAGLLPIFGSVLGADGLFRAIDPVNANYTSAFGSGPATASLWTRADNSISYKTPTFAGLTGYAMYSFKMNGVSGKGVENKASADRYGSLALRYQNGPAEAILVGDMTFYGNEQYGDADNGWTLTAGGNYRFDSGLKLLAFYQQFDHMQANFRTNGVTGAAINQYLGGYGEVDGFGAGIGAQYKTGAHGFSVGLNHRDMDNTEGATFKRWTVDAGYDYTLSKRTSVYVMGGWTQEKADTKNGSATPSGYEFCAGIVHRF